LTSGGKRRRPRPVPAAFFAVAAASIFFPLFAASCEVQGKEVTRLSLTGVDLATGNQGRFQIIDADSAQSLGISSGEEIPIPDRSPEPLVIAAAAAAVLGFGVSVFTGRQQLIGLLGLGGLACLLALWAKAAGERSGFDHALALIAETPGDVRPILRLTVLPAFWIGAAAQGAATLMHLWAYLQRTRPSANGG
jgi:hypothetical protein